MCCGVHGFAKMYWCFSYTYVSPRVVFLPKNLSFIPGGKLASCFYWKLFFSLLPFFFVPVTAVYCCVCLCFLFLTCSIHLYIDSVDVQILWRLFCQELFYCHGLRKLTVSDNDLISIPPAVASLANLEHLDFSKNGNWFTFIVIILQCNKHTVVKILSHFLRCIVLNSLGLVLAVFLM